MFRKGLVAASLKTRQGLKLIGSRTSPLKAPCVAASLKTRQGLKLICGKDFVANKYGCSELENPTGIETKQRARSTIFLKNRCSELENPTGIETFYDRWRKSKDYKVAASLKTRQGLKLICGKDFVANKYGCSELENPTGIETKQRARSTIFLKNRCSELENPTGIETFYDRWRKSKDYKVAASLKTRQGLKLPDCRAICLLQALLQRA